ncbi:MAG: ATP-binding protein [Clostridiales bacterium]|nr:ATP-binding protein [Clostridiales bacterium]
MMAYLELLTSASASAPLFCLQLMAATGIQCVSLKRRPWFPLRLVCAVPVCLVLSQWLDGVDAIFSLGWLQMPPFEIWVLMLPVCLFLFDVTKKEMLFVCLAGMATQHSCIISTELLLRLCLPEATAFVTSLLTIPLYLLLCGLAYLIFARKINREIDIRIRANRLLLVAAATMIFTMVLRRAAVDNLGDSYSLILKGAVDLYGVMGCLVSLWVLFSNNTIDEMRVEQLMMEQVMRMEEEKHRFSQATIDTINLRCHDLKHQLERLQAGDDEISRQALQELADSVTVYSKIAKTGSDVLDSILTQESLRCERYHIHFTCIADGVRLGYMKSTDLYSLFGNAIDNAIEAVQQEPEEEKRVIFLKVAGSGDYISIHLENYCPGQVSFRDGIPQTDKPDREQHGYGMKSMQYVVRKYGGNLVCRQEGQMFYLNILLEAQQP